MSTWLAFLLGVWAGGIAVIILIAWLLRGGGE